MVPSISTDGAGAERLTPCYSGTKLPDSAEKIWLGPKDYSARGWASPLRLSVST